MPEAPPAKTLDTDKTNLALPSDLEPGDYRVLIVANASGFDASEPGIAEFKILTADELQAKEKAQQTEKLAANKPKNESAATAMIKNPPLPRHTPVDFTQGSMGPVFWTYNFSSTSGQKFNLMAATVTAISADVTKWFAKTPKSAWALEARGRQTNIYMFENSSSEFDGQSKITIADRRIALNLRQRKIIDRVGIDVVLGIGTHHYTYLVQEQLNSIIRPIEGQLLELYIGGAIDWQVRSGSHTMFDLTFHPVGSAIGITADQTWQYTATLKYMRQILHERSYLSLAFENFRSRVNTHSEYFTGEAATISTWYRIGLGLAIKI